LPLPNIKSPLIQLRDAIASKCAVKDGPQEVLTSLYLLLLLLQLNVQIDISPWLARTALELIGQSGFGYSFDPLTEGVVSHSYAFSVKQIA